MIKVKLPKESSVPQTKVKRVPRTKEKHPSTRMVHKPPTPEEAYQRAIKKPKKWSL